MKYAKLINNEIKFAPNPINIDNNWYGNPPVNIYLEQGYKPVEYAEEPEYLEGYEYISEWEETEDKIIQRWVLKEINYGWVDWTAQDGDGGDLRTKEQARTNFKKTINADIEVVLMHDYSSITLSVLPEFIEYLQEKNYILLPLFYESVMVNK